MNELTEDQVQEVGGGLDGVPYHYGSQRIIMPPLEIERPLGPVRYPGPPEPVPSFGG